MSISGSINFNEYEKQSLLSKETPVSGHQFPSPLIVGNFDRGNSVGGTISGVKYSRVVEPFEIVMPNEDNYSGYHAENDSRAIHYGNLSDNPNVVSDRIHRQLRNSQADGQNIVTEEMNCLAESEISGRNLSNAIQINLAANNYIKNDLYSTHQTEDLACLSQIDIRKQSQTRPDIHNSGQVSSGYQISEYKSIYEDGGGSSAYVIPEYKSSY